MLVKLLSDELRASRARVQARAPTIHYVTPMVKSWRGAGSVALWTVTVLAAVAIGSSGLSKLLTKGEWDRLFASWGYPIWFMFAVGCAEVVGAAALFVRRFAWAGALVLAAVMLGAAATLLVHPGSHFFRGRQAPMTAATPLVWFVLLSCIGVTRWAQGRAGRGERSGKADPSLRSG